MKSILVCHKSEVFLAVYSFLLSIDIYKVLVITHNIQGFIGGGHCVSYDSNDNNNNKHFF